MTVIVTKAYFATCPACEWHGPWHHSMSGRERSLTDLDKHYKNHGYCPTLNELPLAEAVEINTLNQTLRDSRDEVDLGWWAISGEALVDALRRAHLGDDPDLIYTELFANSSPEEVK